MIVINKTNELCNNHALTTKQELRETDRDLLLSKHNVGETQIQQHHSTLETRLIYPAGSLSIVQCPVAGNAINEGLYDEQIEEIAAGPQQSL
jgi:hypothetical protein